MTLHWAKHKGVRDFKKKRPEINLQIQNLPTYSTDIILLDLIPMREHSNWSTRTF